jgi:hypothetical protein
MVDQNALKEMIEKQEKIVKEALEQLKELKSMAPAEKNKPDVEFMNLENLTSSIREEVEKRRSEIMDRVEKIKIEAQSQAKRAMDKASAGATSMPSMGMSPMGMPPMGIPSYFPATEKNDKPIVDRKDSKIEKRSRKKASKGKKDE